MADEALYGESNKRKYDESPPPVARRATGFSSGPDFAAPPSSYNTVPPPLNEIELAKQKAQEIAARLLNNSDPSKRARVENTNGAGAGAGAGYGGGGFDSFSAGSGPKHSGLGLGGPLQGASYGYPGPSKKIEIPNGKVGMIIGKGGETIKTLQISSGAKIQVTRDTDADPNSATRAVELTGAPEEIAKAEEMINDVLSQADTGGSGTGNRRFGTERFSMMVPNNKVGLVIGKGGETIKSMQIDTGARIQVIPLHLPPGDMSKERTVQIDGTSDQIEAAKQMIEEVTSENRMRNQSMGGGGYNSQQGYQSRPPTNWSQPGLPMQQPAYGYAQSGGYSVPPQYNMNQQQPNYPSYPPTSGGYATGWDQSMAPQNQQTAQGGGSYDYYSQQQPPTQQQTQGGSTDGSGYNYQAQAYSQGQGYGQDGYGYNYGQTQTNPIAGYNQQQQGYNNAAYGNMPNPATDGQNPSYEKQSDSNQAPAQPSPNPNDPHQGSTQPGYGTHGGYGTLPPSGYGSNVTPQTQKPSGQPAAYVQPQQSPSSQGAGYAQYSQAPPVQLGYAQADAAAQRPPASQPGYAPPPYGAPPPPAAQSGYGAPPYAAPPPAQPGYGQHPYGSGYGGGYTTQQAPAYPADATAPQPAGAPGATKASPPS